MSISASTRKSIVDVTRRRGRTILVVLGIMIGILGLKIDPSLWATFCVSFGETAR